MNLQAYLIAAGREDELLNRFECDGPLCKRLGRRWPAFALQNVEDRQDLAGDWYCADDILAVDRPLIAAAAKAALDADIPLAREAKKAASNAIRDSKIEGGFPFMGKSIQSRPSDRENILGLGAAAQAAIAAGAQPGDLRWFNPDADFAFITADNSLLPLDAHQMVGLYSAGMAFKAALTFYARALKDAVAVAPSIEMIAEIDIDEGWP